MLFFIAAFFIFTFFRIAGLDYGDNQIEYSADGPRDEHRLPLQELLSRLVTDIQTGLTNPQVRANLELYGYNSIASSLKVPEWVRFLKCFFGPVTQWIWVPLILCFVHWSIFAGQVIAL